MKSLKPIGRALKLGRSRAGRAVLNTSLGRITRVQIKENASKLVLNVHPNEPAEGKVVVEVKVPERVQYQPLLIFTLEIEGTRGEAEAIIGVLPVDDESHKVTVKRALQDDKSYSVGALSFLKRGDYYLAYRWRNGNKDRGRWLEISRSHDGLNYDEVVVQFKKEDYGYLSFEQPGFAKNAPETVFLYSADVERKWNIFLVTAGNVEELQLPGRQVIEWGKDPAVLYDNRYIVVYSNTRNPGHDLTVLETEDFERFEVKVDSLFYGQLHWQGNEWARTHIHAGALHKSGEYYVLFYDALPKLPSCFGSGWLGIAVSKDLERWVDLTPEAPLWQGNGVDKTFRYVDLYTDGEKYIFYAEVETTAAGRKDIVAFYDE